MMPLSLPIIAAASPCRHARSAGDAHGVTAIASASAASSDCGSAFGSSTPIIMRICTFSPWPAPTMVFFTRLGAYSATGSPASAGTSMAMPRAWPSLSVAAASLLTKVASTAASSGAYSSTTRRRPSWMVTSRASQAPPLVGLDRAAGDEREPVAVDLHHAPAGAAEPGIDAEDANRARHDPALIAPRAIRA